MVWSSRGCREQRRGVTNRDDVWVSRRTAGEGKRVGNRWEQGVWARHTTNQGLGCNKLGLCVRFQGWFLVEADAESEEQDRRRRRGSGYGEKTQSENQPVVAQSTPAKQHREGDILGSRRRAGQTGFGQSDPRWGSLCPGVLPPLLSLIRQAGCHACHLPCCPKIPEGHGAPPAGRPGPSTCPPQPSPIKHT